MTDMVCYNSLHCNKSEKINVFYFRVEQNWEQWRRYEDTHRLHKRKAISRTGGRLLSPQRDSRVCTSGKTIITCYEPRAKRTVMCSVTLQWLTLQSSCMELNAERLCLIGNAILKYRLVGHSGTNFGKSNECCNWRFIFLYPRAIRERLGPWVSTLQGWYPWGFSSGEWAHKNILFCHTSHRTLLAAMYILRTPCPSWQHCYLNVCIWFCL